MNAGTNGDLGVRRSLVCFGGSRAATAAQRIDDLSCTWLGCKPPLALLNLAAGPAAAVQAAIDGLAGVDQTQALHRVGLYLAHPDEVAVWLVLDLLDPEAALDPGGLNELLGELRRQAWSRLRANIRPQVLLLADPAAGETLGQWHAALAASGVEQVWLAGPVNRSRVRFADNAWIEQASTAVAGLLWTDTAAATREPDDAPWRSARRPGTATLPRCARRWWSGSPAASSHALPSRQAWRNGPSSNGFRPPSTRPAWPQPSRRPNLPACGATGSQASPCCHSSPRGSRQRPAGAIRSIASRSTRCAKSWLSERLAAGEQQLAAQEAAHVRAGEAWSRPGGWAQQAEARKGEVLAALALLEDDLEAAGHARDAAETMVLRAEANLSALVSVFPQPGSRGALRALFTPWRWPAWAWGYVIVLPRTVQRLLDAYAGCEAAAWHEANIHLARQALLGLAQTAGDRAVQAQRAFGLFQAAAEANAAEAAPPWPWTDATLDSLATSLFPPVGPDLVVLLEGLGDRPEDATTLIRRVRGWVTEVAAALAWTTAEQLIMALDEPRLTAWLDELGERAQPLWPADAGPSDGDDPVGQLTWRPARRRVTPPAEEEARLARWSASRPHSSVRVSAADALCFIGAARVALDDGLAGPPQAA